MLVRWLNLYSSINNLSYMAAYTEDTEGINMTSNADY